MSPLIEITVSGALTVSTTGLAAYLAKRVLTPPADELGKRLHRYVKRLLKSPNVKATTRKTSTITSLRGTTKLKPIPARLLPDLLEAIARETDPTLQDMWAALLANAIDAEKPDLQKRFIDALRAMDPDEAKVLSFFKSKLKTLDPSSKGAAIPADELVVATGYDLGHLKIVLHSLTRLACFRSGSSATLLATTSSGMENPWPYVAIGEVEFYPTDFGAALLSATDPVGADFQPPVPKSKTGS